MSLPALSLREKCAQMVFVDHRFDRPDPERSRRLAALGVGGACLFYGERDDVAPLVNALQRAASVPLLVASDYEHGAGHQVAGATVFPTNMALGATGSEALARSKGRCTGLEARALGVPWVLAPVVDVNVNPRNPIINTRSFGSDPELVARLAGAFLEGLRDAGALGCLKHFPGHGDVTADSHLELPVVDRPRDALEGELLPYRRLAGRADSVMTAHLLVRALDPERPVSLSEAATGLLRRELGFAGLVSTDALMMGGITRFCSEREALELAVRAGADVLLYPLDPEAAIATLEEAVRAGRIPPAAVDAAVGRILAAKERAGLFRERLVDERRVRDVVGCAEHQRAAAEIAEAAITRVRGDALAPREISYVHVADASARGDLTLFERELAVRARVVPGASTCVVGVFFKQKAFAGKTGLDGALVARVAEAARSHARTIIVAFGSPYVLGQLPPGASAVCAYGEDAASQRAAARALAGEIPFPGRLPVELSCN